MNFYKKMPVWAFLTILAMILSACVPGEETPDPQALITQAAATVSARLTQDAAAQPTVNLTEVITQIAGTIQAQITQTAAAQPTQTHTPGITQTSTVARPVAYVAPTVPVALGNAAEKCEYITQFPADNSAYGAGWSSGSEDWYWEVKNSGTTTWTTAFQYRFYTGDLMTQNDVRAYSLKSEVKPGSTIRLYYDPKVPNKNGNLYQAWVLVNAQGINFCAMDLTLKVTGAAATTLTPGATRTVTPGGPTLTPNSWEWMCTDAQRSLILGQGCDTYCKLPNSKQPCYVLGVPFVKTATAVPATATTIPSTATPITPTAGTAATSTGTNTP